MLDYTATQLPQKPDQACYGKPLAESLWKQDEIESIAAKALLKIQSQWRRKPNDVVVTTYFNEKYKLGTKRIKTLCANLGDFYAPNLDVQEMALVVLDLLKEKQVLPSLINSTGDESLLLEFFVNQDSYSLDFYNSGEIVYLRKIQGRTPSVAEVSSGQLVGIIQEIAHAYARVDV